MGGYGGYTSHKYEPSAPPLPEATPSGQPPSSGYGHQPPSYGYAPPHYGGSGGSNAYFPPGTNPEVIQSFKAADRDGSGSIDEGELQAAISSGYQKFSLRSVRLLLFLFRNPNNPSKLGPTEFAALWNCLGQWRAIFERFDRDRSGEIDSAELKDAFLSLGLAVPPSVLQVLISKYSDGKGRRVGLNFDSFVECGMIVKGLTEKFKEKDPRYTGSATLTYDAFMLMIIPFIV